ncbi:MAG: hypothetical protein IPF92_20035 [Myxococcales bacterium]|nr:hypothetical protein [Myxococcales bacterium]
MKQTTPARASQELDPRPTLRIRTAVRAGSANLIDGDDGRDNSFGAIARPRRFGDIVITGEI